MTDNQFSVMFDEMGNIFCRPGVAIDLGATTTAYFKVGAEIVTFGPSDDPIDPFFNQNIRYGNLYMVRFVGGSGQSMRLDGSLSQTFAPTGYFRRIGKYKWVSDYGQKVIFDPDTGDADLVDVDESETVLATFSDPSATFAPVGTFTGTVDGEDIYNGGSAFTLTATYEGVAEDLEAVIDVLNTIAPIGTFPIIAGGVYSYSSGDWISDDDPFWTISIDSSGNGTISDGTDIVAERLNGDEVNPMGTYQSTAYGENVYNGDEPFEMNVGAKMVNPMTGYVYAKLTLDSGRIDSADGIFFGSTMPANTSTEQYIPIAYSNGNGRILQIQQGPIYWK